MIKEQFIKHFTSDEIVVTMRSYIIYTIDPFWSCEVSYDSINLLRRLAILPEDFFIKLSDRVFIQEYFDDKS